MVENPLRSLLNSTTEKFYLRKYNYNNGGEKRADGFEKSLMQELIPADIINHEQRATISCTGESCKRIPAKRGQKDDA